MIFFGVKWLPNVRCNHFLNLRIKGAEWLGIEVQSAQYFPGVDN